MGTMKTLIEAGADVNAKTRGGTDALSSALACKHCTNPPCCILTNNAYCKPCVQRLDLIEMLLASGAKVEDRHIIQAAKGMSMTHVETEYTTMTTAKLLKFY